MIIRFIGPCGRVTGSCYHLTDDGRGLQILVDCGLVQEEGQQLFAGDAPLPFDPARIDHVLLTHAHLDHVGMVPELYRRGFRGPVWCTRETRDIAICSLLDAVRQGNMPYGEENVRAIRWKEPDIQPLFNNRFPIATDLWGCFFRSAHIVGAVSISLAWGPQGRGQRTIVFSGDLGVNEDGRETQALLKYRMDDRNVDYAVCESTYGRTQRPAMSWRQRLDALAAALDPICAARGVGIIPVFSIGRCQDLQIDLAILLAMHPERFADLDIRVHAPMGMRVSEITATACTRMEMQRNGTVKPVWLNPQLGPWIGLDRSEAGERALRDVVVSILRGTAPPPEVAQLFPDAIAARVDARRLHVVDQIATMDPCRPQLIVASAGMCTGGPVRTYLQRHLAHPQTTVLLAGYAGSRTLAGQLAQLSQVPLDQRRKLTHELDLAGPGDQPMRACDVQAEIRSLAGYSGHADQTGLIHWLVPPKTGVPVARTVFLTHGQDQARQALAERLTQLPCQPITVIQPQHGQGAFDLDLGSWCGEEPGDERSRLLARIRALEAKQALAG